MARMIHASYGVGRYQASEADVLLLNSRWRGDGTIRGVIFCHGVNSDATAAWTPATNPNLMDLMAQIAEAGYPVLSVDAGGAATWGNDTAIARVGTARTYLQGAAVGAKAGKVLLIGVSMGALNCFAYAGANAVNVAALVGFIPVSDLTDMRANNRGGYQASIDTAYGGTYSEGSFGATHNPQTMAAAGKFAAVPTRLFYASDDTTVVPATVTTLASTIGAGATATNVGAVGHTDAAVGGASVSSILTFLAANA